MTSLLGFIKKEWMAQFRSARLYVLAGVFLLLGLCNPILTKLTPLMLDFLADSLEQAGMDIGIVQVDALFSWTEYFSNISLGIIVFLVVQGNLFTSEYGDSTLVQVLTKGLARYKIVVAKAITLSVLWTVYYWMCFAVTYALNAYFWDNSVVDNLFFSGFCTWLYGMWIVCLIVFYSTLAKSAGLVILGSGGTFFAMTLIGSFRVTKPYTPSLLSDPTALLYGLEGPAAYWKAIVVTVVLGALAIAASIPLMNKKKI